MRVPCIIGAVYVVKDSYFYLEGIKFSLITKIRSLLFYILIEKACIKSFASQTGACTGHKNMYFFVFLFCAFNPT